MPVINYVPRYRLFFVTWLPPCVYLRIYFKGSKLSEIMKIITGTFIPKTAILPDNHRVTAYWIWFNHIIEINKMASYLFNHF